MNEKKKKEKGKRNCQKTPRGRDKPIMLGNFLKMLANVTIINLLIFLFYFIIFEKCIYIYIFIKFLSNDF